MATRSPSSRPLLVADTSRLSAEQMSRFQRQILLSEVGEAGQARIVEATAQVLPTGVDDAVAHELASTYVLRAGVRTCDAGMIDVEALAPRDVVRAPAARQVVAGSRAALRELRRAVRLEDGSV